MRRLNGKHLLFVAVAFALSACGTSSGSGDTADDAGGTIDGNSSHDAGASGNGDGASVDGSAVDATGGGGDGGTGGDASVGGDGSAAGDAATSSDSAMMGDAPTGGDGSTCTPAVGGSFECNTTSPCNSATQYCAFGGIANTCEPLPAECQCEETRTCACILARSGCVNLDGGPDDQALLQCQPYTPNDAGGLGLVVSNCVKFAP